ncbi:MAG: DUF445 domain-containing protein [Acidimicrobiia bacterium]|nr:DUF445 domain-containing protein [Acidimicrobiia bacterium]MYG70977.1 DUF445 domain-containing protein [Acidimicrobiia bacterium]
MRRRGRGDGHHDRLPGGAGGSRPDVPRREENRAAGRCPGPRLGSGRPRTEGRSRRHPPHLPHRYSCGAAPGSRRSTLAPRHLRPRGGGRRGGARGGVVHFPLRSRYRHRLAHDRRRPRQGGGRAAGRHPLPARHHRRRDGRTVPAHRAAALPVGRADPRVMDAPNGRLSDPASLRRAKWRATGLLLAAAVLFVVMRLLTDGDGWAGYVEAAAEAAMIGGLADWFAVTALFKHPLGIPIPHTAIIPRRKNAIGASLGEFVQDNFFEPDDLGRWVADRAPAEALGRWLAAEGDAGLVSGPALGRLLESMVEGGHHRSMVDAAVQRADRFLVDNFEVLRDRIVEEAPIYTPKVLDHHIFTRLHRGVRGVLADMADDPEHELRLRIDAGLRSYAQRLQTSQRLATRVEAVLARAGESLQGDSTLQNRVDRWLVSAVGLLARHAQAEVANVIGSTVARWDADDTSSRIERRVGRDLQFIRINGTLIGALAGLAIHGIKQVL